MTFDSLGLAEPLLRALADAGHTAPTPIQLAAIPPLLAGKDVCATAQTGTGKTAAFALPILHRLAATPSPSPSPVLPAPEPPARPRALVLAPTRELAVQIHATFVQLGAGLSDVRCSVLYGSLGARAQRRALEGGVGVLVATPGRLLDLCGQGLVQLDGVESFVLDEVDRMLDASFLVEVRAVLKRLPARRQSALFSATLPPDIQRLADQVLRKPVRVAVAAPAAVATGVEQRVLFVERPEKRAKVVELLSDPAVTSAIVFARTKHAVDRLGDALTAAGIPAAVLHGDKSQPARTAALQALRDGTVRVLVATDVAARGLDVPGVSHVVNHDIPEVPESYVHRIGRTARAGAGGVAISLCASDEKEAWEAIKWLTRPPTGSEASRRQR